MDFPFRIPEALTPIIFGLLVWFGVCYLWITPTLSDRVINRHIAAECEMEATPENCPCVFDHIRSGKAALLSALFVASFTLSEPRIDLLGESRHPYIEWVSRQAQDAVREGICASESTGDPLMTDSPEDYQSHLAALVQQHEQTLEAQRQESEAQLRALEAATQEQINAIADSSAAQYAQEEFERIKRANALRGRAMDTALDVGEAFLNWVDSEVDKYEQKYPQSPYED